MIQRVHENYKKLVKEVNRRIQQSSSEFALNCLPSLLALLYCVSCIANWSPFFGADTLYDTMKGFLHQSRKALMLPAKSFIERVKMKLNILEDKKKLSSFLQLTKRALFRAYSQKKEKPCLADSPSPSSPVELPWWKFASGRLSYFFFTRMVLYFANERPDILSVALYFLLYG